MILKRYSPEKIIGMLREAEVCLAQEMTDGQVSPVIDFRADPLSLAQTIWRSEDQQVKRIKDIERENTRLKRAVADLTLEKVVLKEALEGNY